MRGAALGIAVLSAWTFGFSGSMAKFLGAGGLTPLQAVWVRMAGAAILLLAILAVFRPRSLRVPRGRLGFYAAYGLVAVAGVQALFFVAITRLPVGVALLLEYTSPVLVVFWVRFVRGVRLPRSAYAGAVIVLVGLGVVVEVWRGFALDGVGLLLGLVAAACCAGYFLMSDGTGGEVDPLGLIAWGLAGAAVVLAPLSRPWEIPWSAFGSAATLGGHTLPVYVAALWLIAVATVLAYITGVTAVRRLSAAVGATVASLEVVTGAVIAWILVGEHLGAAQIAGGAVVLAGALLAQTATSGASRTTEEPAAQREASPAASGAFSRSFASAAMAPASPSEGDD
ncbi:membrane protein [Sphaerisporangium siamense]|uniref:Drug/metabolite transporter (DMT)-like permease n=1 Tax=Sphaerisporangium siamense TaxID=795645 RepID=A0A7W7D6J7_9ACTN|nr:EamA family transporter [Sphaerisporangium siamense]MBB4700996.1 drug/metabolite transporter (DMT)-like permease [Sphaerisporangium siamense]GII85858.1 membrane protein [Sphaerisporangium siamense]